MRSRSHQPTSLQLKYGIGAEYSWGINSVFLFKVSVQFTPSALSVQFTLRALYSITNIQPYIHSVTQAMYNVKQK